jgi:hypothetical protein
MRPLSALAALGTAAHHGFEVRSGVGLVFEPWLGRAAATALWSGLIPTYVVGALAARPDSLTARLVTLGNGMSLSGGVVHYVQWPWELRDGIPTLTAAEGMTEDRLPTYNRILQVWTLAGALALLLETPRTARRWGLAGVLMGEPLRRSAIHHFRWAAEQARRDPDRWSPVLAR